MLVKYVKDNYNAMFHDPSYQGAENCPGRNFSVLLEVKF